MKELKIGDILAGKRRDKGITQDEVAEYAGVSKASVSKWENGLCYPDITILPRLATYFNISIDELMGYHPQLNDKEIQKKYREFSAKFANRPFADVMDEVRKFIREYDSCYPLLFYMIQLYLNNYMLAPSPKEGEMVLEEAKALCTKILKESEDTLLKKDALSMEAFLCILKKEPEQVLQLLGDKVRPILPAEPFIIGAYQMLGEQERALEYLEGILYQELVVVMDYLGSYFALCGEDKKEECLSRAGKMAEAFSMEQLLPYKVTGIYHSRAVYYAEKQEEEKAVKALGDYVRLAEREEKNFCIHGDGFFDRLEQWMEDTGLGSQLPRDPRLVRRDLVLAVTEHPAFAGMKENPEFMTLEKKLKSFLEDSMEV